MMKRIVILLFALFPLFAVAQNGAAAMLDKAVAVIKSDAAVQMDYDYTVYDDDDVIVYSDNGTMKLDNDRYSLVMENMKVWCDGKVQWSYMKDIDEVYITDADSEEAQNLSPLYIMERYRTNYALSLVDKGPSAVVVLTAGDAEEEIGKIELAIDKKSARLQSLFIYMPSQGRVEVFLNNYVAKCSFGDKDYECPVNAFSTAEIIDMR